MTYPPIIQGGMGAAISTWTLARAVSLRGQLGVVSGTGLDAVFARRLQLGDAGGHMLRGVDAFPLKEMAKRVWDRYFVEGGKRPCAPFKSKPIPTLHPPKALTELAVVASFVEVHLAKRGHGGLVGFNLLEKIQLPTLPSLFGAMLAGVDCIFMGAGIPRFIPGVLDRLSAMEPAELPIDVAGARSEESFVSRFDPRSYCDGAESLGRPAFFAIVSSTVLAQTLARKSTGRVDGFIVEGPTAGGHNAPPRGTVEYGSSGEPIYGPRDVPDFEAFKQLGLPFWLAGSFGSHEKLREAQSLGAQGIQVGTAFAFCRESGMAPKIKADVLERVLGGRIEIRTDPLASTTGFPFKVAQLPGTLSEASVYEARARICDLGFLRQPYRKEDGSVGYRCPGEPVEDYVAKGGDRSAAAGRMCLCNGLLATAGFPQVRKGGYVEPPVVTAGDDLVHLSRYLKAGQSSYSAGDVLDCVLGIEQKKRAAPSAPVKLSCTLGI